MAQSSINTDIRRFIQRRIPSVEHLEILLLLQASAQQWWSASGLAATVGIGSGPLARLLEELATLGFLDVRIAEQIHYRYDPATEEQGRLLEAVARIYQERRMSVLALIAARPLEAVRDFADAFRLKKEVEDDG